MKRITAIACLLVLALLVTGQSRRIIHIPDILGYKTLKCDFHMHTVFSDGTVWPTVRVQEAWEEGLDAISITEHLEYLPHSMDIVADHNRSYEVARPLAAEMDILLVRGAEITRRMPPGHLNALFINNANLMDREDVNDALQEASDQGAFIFWNHPGWKEQQPDTTLWWDVHTQLYESDKLHGIEVYNTEFCPEALDWADEKGLSVLSNSDAHGPMDTHFGHRAMTLVFSKGRNYRDLKEALFSGRTLAYYGNNLAGNTRFLEAIFMASIKINDEPLNLRNRSSRKVLISNRSDIDYELELTQPGIGFSAPEKVLIKAHHVTSLELKGNSDQLENMNELNLYYEVKNCLTRSNENLVVTLSVRN